MRAVEKEPEIPLWRWLGKVDGEQSTATSDEQSEEGERSG
jgi:hypothetical protein